MRIAIIGAGFAGLASAWHLLQHQSPKIPIHVTVFDPSGIGGGASGIAAGLVHPFAGAHAKLNRKGLQGYQSTLKLLEVASKAINTPVADYSGLLRIALTENQKTDFYKCCTLYTDHATWLTAEQCQGLIPGIVAEPGIFIRSSVTVNCELYLKGLWKAIEEQGGHFKQIRIEKLSQLEAFDVIIVAVGAAAASFTEFSDLPITQVKGQLIELEWPKDLISPSLSINSQAYMVMNPDRLSCLVGATFERDFFSAHPNLDIAKDDLVPKAASFFPILKELPIIGCRAGLRASTPNHLPYTKRMNEKCWILTGFGSKGLLYHSLYAQEMSQEIMKTHKSSLKATHETQPQS